MPKEKLTVDNLTQEEIDYILKKRQRELRAHMKSENTLKDYLKNCPTVQTFLKKLGITEEPHCIATVGSTIVYCCFGGDDFGKFRKFPAINFTRSTFTIKTCLKEKLLTPLTISVFSYNNKVFGIEYSTSTYQAPAYLYGRITISKDFKKEILLSLHSEYQQAILREERTLQSRKEDYDKSKNNFDILKKFFGKKYNYYKNYKPTENADID